MRSATIAFAVAVTLAAGGAYAQSGPAASGLSTGSAGAPADIPAATGGAGDRTGSITATGQTKPPGAAVGDGEGTNTQLEQRSRELDRKINRGICKGC